MKNRFRNSPIRYQKSFKFIDLNYIYCLYLLVCIYSLQASDVIYWSVLLPDDNITYTKIHISKEPFTGKGEMAGRLIRLVASETVNLLSPIKHCINH